MPDVDTRNGGPPVLVAGAGAAGLAAALTLARLGVRVHLVERHGHLGGQVMRLDKLYPTDHCAFCPVWTEASACREHPLVTVGRNTRLETLETGDGHPVAVLVDEAPAVDPDRCVFCGTCRRVCADQGSAGAIVPKPADVAWDPGAAPAMRIDLSLCSACGACVQACPAQAIDLKRQPRTTRLEVADVVFATGFAEPDASPVPEFGLGSHPDVFTAMAFEAWTSDTGPNAGRLIRRATGKPPRSLAFIQCAGSRDQRFLPYCSSVCCMHALKQARWMKRRFPEVSCAVFFTDLRAVGKGYEAYARAARAEGVILTRSRPGLVIPAPTEGTEKGPLAVRYEDPDTGRVLLAECDMVVLNGGLVACPLPGSGPAPERGDRCGFCQEPGDVAQSVIQGTRAASLAAARLASRQGDTA